MLLLAACSSDGSSTPLLTDPPTASTAPATTSTTATSSSTESTAPPVATEPVVTEPVVPTGPMCPPSPAGRIAYALSLPGAGATGGDLQAVHVILPDGSNDSVLFGGDEYLGTGEPSWSPDGTRAAIAASQDSDALYVVRCDGTIETVLSGLSLGTASAPVRIEMPSNPSWLPDGSTIAFASADGLFLVDPADPEFDIPTTTDFYGLPGSQSIVVTQVALDLTVTPGRPSWSPDGTRLVFGATDSSGNIDVYAVGLDGSGLTRLTTDAADDYQPAWSPDGSRIAFRSSRDGALWMMTVDGSNQQPLFSGEGAEAAYQPSWSPDGTELVYVSGPAGDTRVHIVGADGSGDRRLTADGASPRAEQWPVWIGT